MNGYQCYRCESEDEARHWNSFGRRVSICCACDRRKGLHDLAEYLLSVFKELALEMSDDPEYHARP